MAAVPYVAEAGSARKREFGVAGAPTYDQRGPVRWLLSHLRRCPLLLVGFAVSVVLGSLLFSAVPRLTGLAFRRGAARRAQP